MLLVAVGIGLTFAVAIAMVVVRARRSRAKNRARAAARHEAKRRKAEGAQRRVKDEARAAAEREAQRQAEEQDRAEKETRVAEEREARRRDAEEVRRRAGEEARAAAEREAQRQAEERRRAEQETRLAVEQEVQRREAEEEQRRAEEKARVAAEREAQLEAGESRRLAEEAGAEREGDAESAQAGLAARTPRQYRPVPRTPASQRAPALPRPERETRDRAIPIEVRLVFEKAGFCRVSLLPRRVVGMPSEFAVEGSGSPPELHALQDDWYQDVMLAEIAHLLREGIEWAGALPGGAAARLSLSGRGIFVLARHDELSGFVSTERLVLGEEHVVLCVAERLPDVRAAIALTESPAPTELDSSSGIPAGWIGLRGVRPQEPVAPSPSGDIIDALRPLPDVEIALVNGIRIDRQTWLSGFPPAIKFRGDTRTLGVITIDGQEATRSQEGEYVAPGWDSLGEHTISCISSSRRYAIRSGADGWEPWDAYAWSLGEPTASGTQSRPAICGVLVRPPQVARSDSRLRLVPASNPILIGARPGEITVCMPRADVRAGLCIGFPWFEPIWAIPSDPLHCDKRAARVILIGPPTEVDRSDQVPSTHGDGRAARRHALASGSDAWCAAIRSAGRKGLQTEPSRIEIGSLWHSYRRFAKVLRRSRR